MIKTLKTSFSLKNTYRVNGILFSLKQIPFIKKLLPQSLYKSKRLKIFANILSVIWEIVSVFVGKFLYLLTAVCGIGALYKTLPTDGVFLHILLFLTVIGTFSNTALLNPSRDKYYAMVLMRMDAREYTLTNYIYYTGRVVVGFLPFTVLFGINSAVPLWLCILLPLCIVGLKAFFVAVTLWDYEKRGVGYNENRMSGSNWLLIGVLLAAAYGLPLLGFAIPSLISTIIFLFGIPLGVIGFYKILTFKDYRAVNKELLSGVTSMTFAMSQATKRVNENKISSDTSISSNKQGFEYLNELFIKRHKRILWRVSLSITCVCLFLIAGLQLVMCFAPETKEFINKGIFLCLPYFLFIMYCINRGTSFTQALFMNCDHSLLTYSFFKKPNFILKLFVIRLREIMKINALPAIVIGSGLALTLYISGGTDDPLNYAVLVVSILCMSLFFSLHYLTMYYLLQPYNAGTELRSGTYRIVSVITYFICYFLMQQPIPTFIFGVMTIVFVIVYCIVASILVYLLAPKTFKLRS